MDEQFEQFEKILQTLADIRVEQATSWSEASTKLEGIHERLDKLNGSVARHEAAIGALQLALVEHPGKCPLIERVGLLELNAAKLAQKNITDKGWLDRIKIPAIAAFTLMFAMLLVLVLIHAPEILAHVKF